MVVIPLDQPYSGCLANKSAEDGVVQVMHQTVREFFRLDGPTAQTSFRMKSSDAHRGIFITCIRYLMLCTAKAVSISQAAGGTGKPWTTGLYEAYAKYLSTRPFINYALEYAERHRDRCGQVAGDSELISQLHTKLDDSPAAYIFRSWIPGHEQQDDGRDFRAALLHAAARMKCPQVVDALLIAGAEVDADNDGKTPLIVTAESGDLETARVLLNRGALIGAKDGNGQTALHLAATNGHGPVSGLLIDRGADKEAKDEKGKTPLHLAATNGHGPVAGLLVDRGADKEAKDAKGRTPLHLTAAKGHESVAGSLIDRGADKEAKDAEGQTPLHLAAGSGHETVARSLIDRGADQEVKDKKGQTPLHLAAANGHNPVIGLLVDRGANKETKDAFGWGLLHTAAWNDHDSTIQMLVQTLNADKEERDKCGWTALHVAAMNAIARAGVSLRTWKRTERPKMMPDGQHYTLWLCLGFRKQLNY